jgi:hypothetical protein
VDGILCYQFSADWTVPLPGTVRVVSGAHQEMFQLCEVKA